MKIDGGVGLLFVEAAYDVADAVVLHHPRHDPWRHWEPSGPRQPTPWNGSEHPGPEYMLEYPALAPHLTVERRWLDEHPPSRSKHSAAGRGPGDAPGIPSPRAS
jgi:hypothetical protein